MGFGFGGLRFRDSSLGNKGSTRSYWRVKENEEFDATRRPYNPQESNSQSAGGFKFRCSGVYPLRRVRA